MNKYLTLASITILLSSINSNLSAQEICNASPSYQKIATASKWANLKNSEGSLKFETNLILKKGLSELGDKKLLLKSTPKNFLKDAQDSDYCTKKLSETTNSPYQYKPSTFQNVDALNSWVGDFSQGSGTEGSDLYKKCDKSCSPQYEYIISKNGENSIDLEAKVVCGLPRDKDDNSYILSASCK